MIFYHFYIGISIYALCCNYDLRIRIPCGLGKRAGFGHYP